MRCFTLTKTLINQENAYLITLWKWHSSLHTYTFSQLIQPSMRQKCLIYYILYVLNVSTKIGIKGDCYYQKKWRGFADIYVKEYRKQNEIFWHSWGSCQSEKDEYTRTHIFNLYYFWLTRISLSVKMSHFVFIMLFYTCLLSGNLFISW